MVRSNLILKGNNKMKATNLQIMYDYFEKIKRKKEKAKKDREREKEYKQKVGASAERQKCEWGKEL